MSGRPLVAGFSTADKPLPFHDIRQDMAQTERWVLLFSVTLREKRTKSAVMNFRIRDLL